MCVLWKLKRATVKQTKEEEEFTVIYCVVVGFGCEATKVAENRQKKVETHL